MDHESDGDFQLSTIKRGVATESAESETLSDHLRDGNDHVLSKEKLRCLECSSPEMSWDEDYDEFA